MAGGIPTTVPNNFYQQAQSDIATQQTTADAANVDAGLQSIDELATAKDMHSAVTSQLDDLAPQAALADAAVTHRAVTSQLDGIQAQVNPNVQRANKFIGSTDWGSGHNTYCETFAEQMTDGRNWGPSAAAAFGNRAQAGQAVSDPTLSGVQPGDLVYFGGSGENGGYGHVGIYTGNGRITSATVNGIQNYPISAFSAPVLGYAPASGQASAYRGNVTGGPGEAPPHADKMEGAGNPPPPAVSFASPSDTNPTVAPDNSSAMVSTANDADQSQNPMGLSWRMPTLDEIATGVNDVVPTATASDSGQNPSESPQNGGNGQSGQPLMMGTMQPAGDDVTAAPGGAQADTADRNQQAVQPVAQYNQQLPNGDWVQVTKMASGDYQTTPISPPSADEQTVYNAQSAATGGFQNPDVNTPLLSGSTQGAQEAVPASPPPTQTTSAQPTDLASVHPGPLVGPDGLTNATAPLPAGTQLPGPDGATYTMTPSTPPAPAQGVQADTADRNLNALSGPARGMAQTLQTPEGQDLLHPDLNSAGGVNRFANEIGQGASKALTGGNTVPVLSGALDQALNPETLATAPLGGAGKLGQIAMGAGLSGASAAAQPGATAGDVAKAAILGGAMSGVAGAGLGKLTEAFHVTPETAGVVADTTGAVRPTPPALANAAADGFEKVAEAPAMAGGAGSGSKLIDGLNAELVHFGQAIPKDATPWEAVNLTSRLDNAALSASEGYGKAYQQFGLKGAERAQFAQWLEDPASLTGPVSQKVADAVNAADTTRQAIASMTQKAGLLHETVENWLPHIVQFPEDWKDVNGAINPAKLSTFTSNLMQRARDENGNEMWPTIAALKQHFADTGVPAKVVDDPAALMAAPVRGLAQAANHAALGDFLRSSPDLGVAPDAAAGLTERIELPPSIARWTFRGNAPEEGATMVGPRGVIGSGEGTPAVLTKSVLAYATPEMKQALTRYTAADLIPTSAVSPRVLKAGRAVDLINHKIATLVVQNPIIHTLNEVSELAKQYTDPRALGNPLSGKGSMLGDWWQAEKILRDPVARTQLLQEAPLNLTTVTTWARKLDDMAGRLPTSKPVLTGAWNGLKYVPSKLSDASHAYLFKWLGQRIQLMSYLAQRRLGDDPITAAKVANAKLAQFSPQDFNALARWAQSHVLVYGQWKAGTYMQYGSVLGKAGFGGYTDGMTSDEALRFTNALRAQYLRGVATKAILHGVLNLTLSGHLPSDNPDGRHTWIDLGNGQYLNPGLFTRDTGLLRAFSDSQGQFNPIQQMPRYALGEINPLAKIVIGLGTNQQYPGGPAITGSEPKTAKGRANRLLNGGPPGYAGFIAGSLNPVSNPLGFRVSGAPKARKG